jgi:hypothetical protein
VATIDCRDGQHTACDTCDCPCHDPARRELAEIIATGYEPDVGTINRHDLRAADAVLTSQWLRDRIAEAVAGARNHITDHFWPSVGEQLEQHAAAIREGRIA